MTAEAIPTFDVARTCPYGPNAQHRQFRKESPITRVELPSGKQAFAVTRHEDIRAILLDPRFSPNRRHPGFPFLVKETPLQLFKKSPLIGMDPAEHVPARRSVVGEFSVRRTLALKPRIQEIVDEHIDAMLAGPRPVDLVEAFSLPVPSLVICELLGVPYADHEFFQARSAKLINRNTPREVAAQSLFELMGYLDDLVTAKEKSPTDDVLGRQIVKQREEGTYDHEALVIMAFLLLIAGHETTANMISLSALLLMKNPDKLAILREDPSKTPAAVEELLRYFTIAELGVARVATEDIEVGGVLIPAGEGVLLLANTGNRDPEVFEQGDDFDPERGARNHLAFGFGAHQCLGQNLARVELQIAIDTLFRRIPGLRPAVPEEELSFKEDSAVYGIYEFPVTW